ncbi:hypothetical protein GGX14DRAFT_606652 [Mycena pura]|uniref:F-box domain-containing protein n=1 Tax=Mycena pura TaxID=153505 RepID=A0AAD6ULA9_9AGAR|nr:hypothetical protein GGX14DRAFT_606652 [Mycena pura]
MHRCLQIPELVELMCSHLDVPYHPEIFIDRQPERGLRRDLAVLARTSTVFSSHALRLLWKSVKLGDLLRCLPSDSFNVVTTTTGDGFWVEYIMEPLRPFRASDWERVLVYASHVKHLVTTSIDLSPIFPEVRRWLPKNVLSNLQGLHWMEQEDDFQYIDHFLSSQLTTICLLDPSIAALSLLSSLARRCPRLTTILLFPLGEESGMQPQVISAVSMCVLGLNNIETLITSTVDPPVLEHLSRLSSVRHLKLHGVPPTLSALPCDKALFLSLQKLCFDSGLESPARFLEWCNKVRLVKFTAQCARISTSDAVHRLFSAASRGISHSSLLEFSFRDEWYGFDPPHLASYLIWSQSLRSLFCFVNLTSVSVSSVWGIDLDDSTVTDMARSWPYIECLEIQSFYGKTAPRATLQCLEAFPKYCPHLTTLCLTFDATVIPISQPGLSLQCLRDLCVEASPISTALPVAQFLKCNFPSLRSISTYQNFSKDWDGVGMGKYDHLWWNVVSLLA